MVRPIYMYIFVVGCLLAGCRQNTSVETAAHSPSTTSPSLPDKVDFNFHVKPILSDRCFKCHGPDANTREADLAFHDKTLAFQPLGEQKDRFAIVAGDPHNSMLVHRIFSSDTDEQMPPPESNLALSDYEKEVLKKWIEQGAEWKKHWAFIPPQKPDIPTGQPTSQAKNGQQWSINEIDQFTLAKMEQHGLQPSPQAPKEKLIRRLYFDLTGLPPSPEDIDRFLNDDHPDAYERLVDTLLNTVAYAERMALDWMDLARYADSHGYQDDLERTMWPWRDWVIHAFRQNMPYDQFVTWQLAGDLLPDATLEQIIATGFNRNHKVTAEGGVIPEEYRVEYVADRTQTFATAFLGMTLECARCHDHKYDPLSQKNYFELFGFFNNVPEYGMIKTYGDTPEPYLTLTDEQIAATLDFINDADTFPEIQLMVMEEMAEPRQAFILNRGLYDQPADEVRASTPQAILPFAENLDKNRYGLAQWLFAEEHPLTARVVVNRLWQQLFGTGIVATSYDFGNQGTLPSHPALLDYLAITFREMGWDVKAMLKYIAMSATYQQAAVVTDDIKEKDPENRWLSAAPRLRLPAEMIRDQALAISGLLNREVGGPSVKPWQPEGLWAEATGGGGGSLAKYTPDEGAKRHRRTLYTFWKRTVPPPNMMILDTPSRDLCSVKRQQTNTPLQALVLLNDPQQLEAARHLARQVLDNNSLSDTEKLEYIFRKATSRFPKGEEHRRLQRYFAEEQELFLADEDRCRKYLKQSRESDTSEVDFLARWAAYTVVANLVLNLDEAIGRG